MPILVSMESEDEYDADSGAPIPKTKKEEKAVLATAMMEEGKVDEDDEKDKLQNSESKRLHSAHSSGMESSVLRFKDVNFDVGIKNNPKLILKDVSGTVKWGHVLAIMGPSGAGKTTLISALTLDAFYGKPSGIVTLNGVPMTDHIFKKHCYVVKQQDKHWPYLSTRETLTYCAELYEVASRSDIPAIVDEIIAKMGLDVCADTRCARLSGGQKRRLSIAIALLKQPTLLFLDEPTSGLDAAAASNIMEEIIRVAKDERIIIVCTIHQPSTKVYNGFDQVMIMSKGREAFTGDVEDATPYFDSIGYPLPPAMNPAEHFLDLVNADFSSAEEVDKILDTWEEKKPEAMASAHGKKGFADDDEQEGVVDYAGTSLSNEMQIMFRRHFNLIIRDPVLYLGRCLIFLVANLVFAFVYWYARDSKQSQTTNKLWLAIWFIGVPTNMGVVAVYALNDEFKSIVREAKNGMVTATSYVLAKTVLVLPIMYLFSLFALGIPGFAIQRYPGSAFFQLTGIWSLTLYTYECMAECLAVWFDDPILGMLQFMNMWFAGFLFGGFLIALDDLYWPFKIFYYIFPYSYYVRSFVYMLFTKTNDWDSCDPNGPQFFDQAVCVNSTSGGEILTGLARVFPVLEDKNTYGRDMGILFAIAVVYKLVSILGIVWKVRKVAEVKPKAE